MTLTFKIRHSRLRIAARSNVFEPAPHAPRTKTVARRRTRTTSRFSPREAGARDSAVSPRETPCKRVLSSPRRLRKKARGNTRARPPVRRPTEKTMTDWSKWRPVALAPHRPVPLHRLGAGFPEAAESVSRPARMWPRVAPRSTKAPPQLWLRPLRGPATTRTQNSWLCFLYKAPSKPADGVAMDPDEVGNVLSAQRAKATIRLKVALHAPTSRAPAAMVWIRQADVIKAGICARAVRSKAP